jgi:hypothetical protein
VSSTGARRSNRVNPARGASVIESVAKVVVPVDDQARALELWIEVAPPGGGPVLVPSPRPRGADIHATYADGTRHALGQW